MVYRVYVEKKAEYAVEAAHLLTELRDLLGIQGLKALRLLQRYDVEGISADLFEASVAGVFSEPPVDLVYRQLPRAAHLFAVEYLPGQFDQRADSAAECIQLISQGERPLVASARVYLLEGTLTDTDVDAIKQYIINPVEAREADLAERHTLRIEYPTPPPVPVLENFRQLTEAEMPAYIAHWGLAMDAADLAFCRDYFCDEGRDPSLTELRMIDTYWSDHCRHTTFGTVLEDVLIEDINTQKSYDLYLDLRKELYGEEGKKPQTLMDIATIGAKALKARGLLKNLDESEEVNACSVVVKVDNGGNEEDWLLLFKNETHNHPTEIEPFGGAATCIGGAIRDPLANRGYVYAAMRVTGAGDPLAPVAQTLPGKLPQRKLVTTAAAGYASYGNQIGLATGQVTELYHPGYVAKRMEIGAVVGAVPLAAVKREAPLPGDVVLLLGGRTGRDGIGGATGSSKAHKTDSVAQCGAEVQKGNPPVERKLQRLFRNPQAVGMIRRCNDFGAGGVSVAIGELADGLDIDLDAIPKKYEGLDGTELAISESQERMAVVVAQQDAAAFQALADRENLEATQVAVVCAEPRLVMRWRGDVIVDIARDFLNSNGAEKRARVHVPAAAPFPKAAATGGGEGLAGLGAQMSRLVADLNVCSQKGLSERFDSTIGRGTVLVPFGGRHQLSPIQAMVHKFPVEGQTGSVSGVAFGFDPYVSEQNPYAGAWLAVAESLAKLVATGFSHKNAYLSFQEYFERLHNEPTRWGKPFASLLGALQAQLDLGVGAIGGKDSMSGSFEELDVPPTLVSFAFAAGRAERIVSPEFKLPGSKLVWLRPAGYTGLLPQAASFRLLLAQVEQLIKDKKVLAAWAPGRFGAAEGLFKMCLGSRLGVRLREDLDTERLFAPAYGSFVLELAEDLDIGEPLGETTGKYIFSAGGETLDMAPLQEAWEAKLEPVFPYRQPSPQEDTPTVIFEKPDTGNKAESVSSNVNSEHEQDDPAQTEGPPAFQKQIFVRADGQARPRALIPVFPGNNCEYDTARAVEQAGGQADIFVVRNLNPAAVAESAAELAARINNSQMVIIPGGFSGGDEPEGSAKLITAFFRGPRVAEAVARLLEQRDGLMLGICNGFQALIKLGLVPYGRIVEPRPDSPTLTFNRIGRHQSTLALTRIASNLSPWLAKEQPGAVHRVAMSHGEGRFVAGQEILAVLQKNGQIATQYVDLESQPTMDLRFNPNGSTWAIEGITSPDGRVFGKMGHCERSGAGLLQNVPGQAHQAVFEGGVAYFSV